MHVNESKVNPATFAQRLHTAGDRGGGVGYEGQGTRG